LLGIAFVMALLAIGWAVARDRTPTALVVVLAIIAVAMILERDRRRSP
jgi:hypothetical protein